MSDKNNADDLIITTLRIPRRVHDWLKGRAKHFGGSVNSELSHLLTEAMDGDAKSRKSAAAAE